MEPMKRYMTWTVAFGAALALTSTACEEGIIVEPGFSELSVSTLLVDFGEIQVGTASSQRQVILENVGGAALELDGVVPGQPFLPEVFSFDPGLDVIQPGSATTITVNFTPRELGAVNSILVVRARESRGEIREVAIELRGTGVTSQVTATPQRLDFGNVLVNTAATRTIEVANTSQFSAPVEFLPQSNIEVCGNANISAFCIEEPTSDFPETETFNPATGSAYRSASDPPSPTPRSGPPSPCATAPRAAPARSTCRSRASRSRRPSPATLKPWTSAP